MVPRSPAVANSPVVNTQPIDLLIISQLLGNQPAPRSAASGESSVKRPNFAEIKRCRLARVDVKRRKRGPERTPVSTNESLQIRGVLRSGRVPSHYTFADAAAPCFTGRTFDPRSVSMRLVNSLMCSSTFCLMSSASRAWPGSTKKRV